MKRRPEIHIPDGQLTRYGQRRPFIPVSVNPHFGLPRWREGKCYLLFAGICQQVCCPSRWLDFEHYCLNTRQSKYILVECKYHSKNQLKALFHGEPRTWASVISLGTLSAASIIPSRAEPSFACEGEIQRFLASKSSNKMNVIHLSWHPIKPQISSTCDPLWKMPYSDSVPLDFWCLFECP